MAEETISASSTTLYRVKWDWELDDFGGEIFRPNLPCVFRCGEINNHTNGHYTPLNKEWQFFWFDLCCKVFYERYHQNLTKKEYAWLAKRWTSVGGSKTAFMNQKGLNTKRNYVLGERMDKEEAAIYTLVCGGASLAGTRVVNDKGMEMLKVDHFDGKKPPPPVETINPYTDPRVFFATTITAKKIRDGFSVNPFPQFKGTDVPVPLIASKDIYYPMKDLEIVNGTEKPSPYFA